MSTHNLCFEQKCEKYRSFLSENFQFLEVKFSVYLNRHVFVMFSSPHIIEIFFLCFPEKGFDITCNLENLHEMSNPIFWEKYGKYHQF